MTEIVQHRGGTAAAWTAANTVLYAREIGVETDTDKFKIGDGSTPWNALPYAGGGAAGTSSAADVTVTPTGDLAATDVQAALAELDSEKIATSSMGVALGVASLGADGKVPTAQLPASSGGVAAGCIAYHAAGSGLPSSTNSQNIALDGEAYDSGGFHDVAVNNSRITIPSGLGGVYLILANASVSVNSTGTRAVRIRKNGTIVGLGPTVSGSVSSEVDAQYIGVLAPGDYIELAIFQNSGATLTISPDTRLSVFRIA